MPKRLGDYTREDYDEEVRQKGQDIKDYANKVRHDLDEHSREMRGEIHEHNRHTKERHGWH